MTKPPIDTPIPKSAKMYLCEGCNVYFSPQNLFWVPSLGAWRCDESCDDVSEEDMDGESLAMFLADRR